MSTTCSLHYRLSAVCINASCAAAAAYRRERLQFRADGTAKVKGLAAASSNSHIIFSEEEEETDKEVTPSHGLPTPSSSSGKVTQELREAFLQQMRSKMESVQLSDKVRLG